MMITGHFVVVLNFDHVLASTKTLKEAVHVAEDHSLSTPRGHYVIFQLGSPVQSGRMGDRIEWHKKAR